MDLEHKIYKIKFKCNEKKFFEEKYEKFEDEKIWFS